MQFHKVVDIVLESVSARLWTPEEINTMLDHAKRTHGNGAAIRLDDEVYQVGDVLPNSRIWDDGDPTDEMLDGTSVIGKKITSRSVGGYFQKYAYIVKGDSHRGGEDNGEWVMRHAKVVGLLRHGDHKPREETSARQKTINVKRAALSLWHREIP